MKEVRLTQTAHDNTRLPPRCPVPKRLTVGNVLGTRVSHAVAPAAAAIDEWRHVACLTSENASCDTSLLTGEVMRERLTSARLQPAAEYFFANT